MKKQFLMPSASILKKSILLALAIGATACSSSSDTTNTTDIKGLVADGYLQNAEVCLDTNEDDDCTANDKYPSVFTDTDGKYTLPSIDPTDLGKYRVIAKIIPGTTTDSDFPDQKLAEATYLTDIGHSFISPLTTLVINESRSTGVSVAEAEASIKTALNLSGTVKLLEDDHVALGKTSDDYKKVHEQAQLVAKALSTAHAEAKGHGKEHAKDIQKYIQEVMNAANINAHVATAGFDQPENHGNHDMTHFSSALASFDAVAPHVHDDMAALKTALTGFSDSYGCVAPKEWSHAMNHCMVPGTMGDDSAMHDHSGMDDSITETTEEESPVADDHGCVAPQRWYEQDEIPGMAAMCM